MLVVVGGSSRKSGKTSVVESLIRENEEAGWTAIKITPHNHPATHAGRADTDRYLAAGATEAHLIEAGDIAKALPLIATSRNVIVESNSVLDYVDPDLCIFVVGEGDAKPSFLRHIARADVVIILETGVCTVPGNPASANAQPRD